MKNRNTVPLPPDLSDSFEVYTANITPENHNLPINNKNPVPIPIPTIRLTQATPSDVSTPSIIAPKTSPRKKVVPKKSKLALLSARQPTSREKDLSDVLRRVNASDSNFDGNGTCNVTVNGGTTMKKKELLKSKDRSSRSTIDIYVDPADDPDIGEIVVVKKKKSRAGLDGLFNDNDKDSARAKEAPREETKWWSIRAKKKERLRNNSLNALKINVTEANTVFPEARQRCGSTPLSPPDSGYADSIALRAMKSIARIGSWAQLKNNNLPRETQNHSSRLVDTRVKSSISSFEVGALSTHTGEDLTNRLSPMASLGHGPPPAHRFLNPSITNTSVRQRTSSSGTLLSVTSPNASVRQRTSSSGTLLSVISPDNYLQPYDNRRSSTSSSSGESNRPGSTYTASGEDTGAWGVPIKPSTNKTKKGMSVKWGSVSSALALTRGRKKSEKEKPVDTDKKLQNDKISKVVNGSTKAQRAERSTKADKENLIPRDKEVQSKKGSTRHTTEGRRRTHVMSVFPGLSFGRSTVDMVNSAVKMSMPPIAEDPNRSCGAEASEPAGSEASRKFGNQRRHVLRKNPPSPSPADNGPGDISDSDSDAWNKNGVSDEEACVRLTVKVSQAGELQATGHPNSTSDPESLPPARPRPRPRPASEQLLGSFQITQRPRPVGMVLDVGNNIGCMDREDVVALSVLEAANSDLASLINRLDLEATPDKERDITSSTYAETIAAWRASNSVATKGAEPVFRVEAKSTHSLPAHSIKRTSSNLHCSVFEGNDVLSFPDKLENTKLTYRDPIAFLDPTLDFNADPISAVGESFAFVNSANGDTVESPLRRIGKVRAMTQAMGAATGAAGATMSKRFSAISASTRASITSLRPYAFRTLKSKPSGVTQYVDEIGVSPLTTSGAVHTASKEQEHPCVLIERPIVPWSVLNKQFGDPVEPARNSDASVYSIDDDSLVPSQGLEIPSSNVASRTSSIASTFGTGAVLARMHKRQLEGLAVAATPIAGSRQTEDPSSRTFGSNQKPIMFTLPPLDSEGGSPSSLYASRFGTEETPTRPVKGPRHVRQSSGLVPISHRPIPQGISVRRKVQYIEQLTRSERDRQEQERKEIARRDAVRYTTRTDRPSTSSYVSHSSASSYGEDLDAGILMSALAFSGGPDIAGQEISISGTPLPPSPGLPPTSPLPIPGSQSFMLPTPVSVNALSIEMNPSPPAPSLLPVIDPSPSPEAVKEPFSLPTFTIIPPQNQQTLSEDGDVDEPMPRAASRSGLSVSGSGSDDDTKQSFDFTGELKRINESGASHRRSFVEQLEAAFKTPAHVTVRGSFGDKAAPPEELIPSIPALRMELDADIEEGLSMMVESLNESMNNLGIETASFAENLQPSSLYPSEVASKPSYGRLDKEFKFGGRAQMVPTRPGEMVKPLENSIARELPGVAALSTSPSPQCKSNELPRQSSISVSTSPVEEDSSILRSIYVHAAANNFTQLMGMPLPDLVGTKLPQQISSRPSDLESITSSKRRMDIEACQREKAKQPTHARQSSDVSFLGFSSFGAVRTKFEFGPDRPDFYSSLETSQKQESIPKSHFRHESLFSIASVSSYGEVIKPGVQDPFNYGEPVVAEDEEARDELLGLDNFGDQKRKKRFSTDSDISSFYFKSSDRRNHTRNQSTVSTHSVSGPPISLYNRNHYGHRRYDSGDSMSSVAAAYSIQGANGGRAAWMRHQQGQSVDSISSEFSAMRLGRPGVGDKMFESMADHYPLTSISASPPESVSGDLVQKSSYDSILDEERRSTVDSIFDNTGHRSSISSDSVFWHDPTNEDDPREIIRPNLLHPTDFYRPLSLFSSAGNTGLSREDDTMITMLGGEHVRRLSLGSSFEASPCLRVEKQKRELEHDHVKINRYGADSDDDEGGAAVDSTSPTAKIGNHHSSLHHKESLVSVKSSKFGELRMNLARNGLLHRESLEDSCLSADGEEDLSIVSVRSNGFSRPAPRRQRKPLVSITHPPDTTPPLSSSEGSGDSQSSIDVEKLKVLLQTAAAGTRSSASRIRSGVRIRASGQGHRRRGSQISRGSVIGTIQEEIANINGSPLPAVAQENTNDTNNRRESLGSNSSFSSEPLRTPLGFEMVPPPSKKVNPVAHIVEPQPWDEEHWVVGLRRYYALRSEANEEISHSRTKWPDTPFSLHALQSFAPPREPAVMQALLEHSQKSYVPLHDKHPRKIRSRPSSFSRSGSYCRPGSSGGSSTKSKKLHRRSHSRSSVDMTFSSASSRVLQPKNVNDNVSSPPPLLAAISPFSPFSVDLGCDKNNNTSTEESFIAFAAVGNAAKELPEPLSVIKPVVRPRVPSATRRTALGWSKRRTPRPDEGNSNNKENEAHGLMISPSESLRIVRPRPRSRVIGKNTNVALHSTATLST